MNDAAGPSAWLKDEFLKRRNKNPQYSLRAFSARLRLPSGRVSELMSGKRRVTQRLARQIIDRLEMPPTEARSFLRLIDAKRPQSRLPRVDLDDERCRQLAQDEFELIADAVHFSLLGLFRTHDFTSDIGWMAERLGAPRREVRRALDRLMRLGIVSRVGTDFVRIKENLATTTDIPSAALRRSHKQTLAQAIWATDAVDPALRDITSICVAINPARVEDAKREIKKFRRALAALLESGEPATEVYNLNIQLVPVTCGRPALPPE